MAISPILSAAVSGLQANAQRVQLAANNVANAGIEGFTPSRAETTSLVGGPGADGGGGVQVQIRAQRDGVDLVAEFTDILAAEAAYKASAQLVRAAEDIDDALSDAVR